jgi:nucleotide-binding universal stress UspA family protein
MMQNRRVLVPLDGSAYSRQVVPFVRELFSPLDTDIALLRVAPLPHGLVGRPPRVILAGVSVAEYATEYDLEFTRHPIYRSQEIQNVQSELEVEMLPDARILRQAGFHVDCVVRFGEPADEIAAYVEEADCAVVALTTHGQTGLRPLLIGSVAAQVLDRVAIPVMLYRPKGRSV